LFRISGVRGDLRQQCGELWLKAREVVVPRIGPVYKALGKTPTRKEWQEGFETLLQSLFLPSDYSFKDQPVSLGRDLANLFFVRVVAIKNPNEGKVLGDRLSCEGHVFDDGPIIEKLKPGR